MVRPIRNKQIPHLQDAIKETAWRQIAEYGAPALSLRAIARELKITAPAIYNYFPDRDALVTALIIDAYKSFGDSQLEARDAVPASKVVARMKAIGVAYRTWAHKYPQRYQLIFGTPIPGYEGEVMVCFAAVCRDIEIMYFIFTGYGLIGDVEGVYIFCYFLPVTAFRKGYTAPVGDGEHHYPV